MYKSLHFKDFDGKCLGFSGTVAQGSRGFFDMGERSKISEGSFNTAKKSAAKEVNLAAAETGKRTSSSGADAGVGFYSAIPDPVIC